MLYLWAFILQIMWIRKKGKIYCSLILIWFVCSATAQYTVTGGRKDPLLAVDNTAHRIKVYLVYGMENVEISYTSSSTSHKWYRYKTKVDALNPEPVSSEQSGTTSVISAVEEGYGYYVDENGAMRHYVWIMDYSKYEFDIQNLEVSSLVESCSSIQLEGDADIETMLYYTPTGLPEVIGREFQVSFNTLGWDEELKRFTPDIYQETFSGNPFEKYFTSPPLIDTEITLTGDLFARYFEVEKSATTPFYETKTIQVYVDTLIAESAPRGNLSLSENEIPAPATITFSAYANDPVASLFIWTIYNDENPEQPIIRYTDEEVQYTFDRAGSYTIELEVSDRTGACIDNNNIFNINITETVMEIPNAFSPGCTPGVNDIFRVGYKSVMSFKGVIFDSWGTEIFYWTNPSQGWDGKYKGRYVAPGPYYYVIEYVGTDGKKHVRKGDVNVFRSKSIQTERNPVN